MTQNKRQLNAIYYLGTLPKYKIEHRGTFVELYHWGNYGWCSQGSYNEWKQIEKVEFL